MLVMAFCMLMYSGHAWNVSHVHPVLVIWFDVMLLLLMVLILAMTLWDAEENEKTFRAALFLCGGALSLFFVFG